MKLYETEIKKLRTRSKKAPPVFWMKNCKFFLKNNILIGVLLFKGLYIEL